ncbi:hypothetical protein [Tsukamurella hominis]|uniref:hypothetical protein n=1 Tax=Tsukamurella hominis TaxID=1970232 RepID=UPI0039E7E896
MRPIEPGGTLDETIRHLYHRILAATGVIELVTDESLIDVGDPADALFWLLSSVDKEGRRVPADLADEVVAVAESLIERGGHLDAKDGATLRDAVNGLRAMTDEDLLEALLAAGAGVLSPTEIGMVTTDRDAGETLDAVEGAVYFLALNDVTLTPEVAAAARAVVDADFPTIPGASEIYQRAVSRLNENLAKITPRT